MGILRFGDFEIWFLVYDFLFLISGSLAPA